MTDAWDELRQRGIVDTAKAAGWLQDGEYWRYPIRDLDDVEVGLRGKRRNYNGTGQKYIWLPDKPESARYYHPSRLRENIAAAGGLLYVAAGEPDVLVLASAGLRNVLSWFGEGSLPSTLLEDLKALGVKSVVYLPDADEAGYTAAWKVYQVLDHTGIGLRMVQWGGKFGDGYDANREWIECKFSAEAFATALKMARDPDTFFLDAQLNTDWRPPLETTSAEPTAQYDGELPAALIADIEAALGVAGAAVSKDGWTKKRVPCLEMNHSKDDKDPSASWNNRTHCLKCHKCGTSMNAKAVAAALGLGWSQYFKAAPKVGNKDTLNIAPADAQSAEPKNKPITVYGQEAIDEVRDIIYGRKPFTVVTFPLAFLHELGGFAHRTVTRKMTAIVGASGDGKTTLMNTALSELRKNGAHVFLDSPEWAPEEHVFRSLQMLSRGRLNYNRIVEHCAALQNDPTAKRFTGEDLKEFDRLTAELSKMNLGKEYGKVEYVRQEPTLNEKLKRLANEILPEYRARGEKWHWYICDYIQLEWLEDEDQNKKNAEEYKVQLLKKFCEDNDMHAIIVSQPQKAEAQRTRETGLAMSSQAMQFIREDSFNLILTMNPRWLRRDTGRKRNGRPVTELVTDENGNPVPYGRQTEHGVYQVVNIIPTKNSTGQRFGSGVATLRNHYAGCFQALNTMDMQEIGRHMEGVLNRMEFTDDEEDFPLENEPLAGSRRGL